MSNLESSPSGTPQESASPSSENPELYKLPLADIDGLESFDETPPAAQQDAAQQDAAEQEIRPPSPPPGPTPAPLRVAPPAPKAAEPAQRTRRRRSFSVFWPLLLIMGGGLLLLQNLGYISGISWGSIWRFWPLLLIALGIDTLFSRRSAVGSTLSALLILALLGGAVYLLMNAASFPWMSQFVQETGWQSERVSHPLSGVERANVTIDWASVPLRLEALDDSPDLIEGTVVYRGRLNFDTVEGRRTSVKLSTDSMGAGWAPLDLDGEERRWVLGLSPSVPLDVDLEGGSGSAELDLRGLELQELGLDVASGSVDMYVPSGTYEIWIEGGSGALDLWLPQEAGVQLVVDGGSGTLWPGERLRLVDGDRDGDGLWESENLSQADAVLHIRLDVSSGAVRIRDWK